MAQVKVEFIPQRYYWIVIKNKRYDKLRQQPGWQGFQDIPNVDDDTINAKNGFKELGANLTEIQIYEDVNFKEFSEIMNGLQEKIIQNWAGKQRSLCFVYYAGHGVMDNMTYAVCNHADKASKIRYPLQQRLKALSQLPGAYVCGIFDCCRERISPAMRGGFEDPSANDGVNESDYINHIFWFGCQENSGVSANSDIAVEFFRELRRVANPADGSVTLPNDMQYWEPGDSGNILFKIKNPLKLYFSDWIPTIDSTTTIKGEYSAQLNPQNQDGYGIMTQD